MRKKDKKTQRSSVLNKICTWRLMCLSVLINAVISRTDWLFSLWLRAIGLNNS